MNKILVSVLAVSLFFAFSCSAVTTATSTIEKVSSKVTAVKSNSFILQNKYIVSVDKNTKIKKSGKDASMSDIVVGKNVTVSGIINKDKKTVTAKAVTILAETAKTKTTTAKATTTATTTPTQTVTKYDFGASVSDGIFKAFGSMFNFIGGLLSK